MRTAPLVLSLCLLSIGTLAAQAPDPADARRWRVGISVGAIRYWGSTTEEVTDEGVIRFYPYRPTPVGVQVEFGGPGLRVGLSAEYAEPGLGGSGATEPGAPGGGTLVVENLLTTYTLTPSVSFRLARLKGGAVLRPGVGLLLERWEIPFEPARTRIGGLGMLTLELPLFGSFVGSATGTIGVTPASPFKAEELPAPYRPAALWRRGLSAAVSYRF